MSRTSFSRTSRSAISWAAARVASSVVPSGASITTCSSLLLSKGSIFTVTSFSGTSAIDPRSNATTTTSMTSR